MRTPWRDYEELARERRLPPTTTKYRAPEPTLFEQLCEWIGRHWLLYSLLAVSLIVGGCMILDSIRGAR